MDDEFLARLRRSAAEVLADEPVEFAFLFGSQARGDAQEDSDTDIALYFTDGVPPRERLERALRIGGRLQAAARSRVDVVVLDDASLALRGRVLTERVVLHSRNEPLRVRFESLALRTYWDFRPRLEEMARSYLRAVAEGA